MRSLSFIAILIIAGTISESSPQSHCDTRLYNRSPGNTSSRSESNQPRAIPATWSMVPCSLAFLRLADIYLFVLWLNIWGSWVDRPRILFVGPSSGGEGFHDTAPPV